MSKDRQFTRSGSSRLLWVIVLGLIVVGAAVSYLLNQRKAPTETPAPPAVAAVPVPAVPAPPVVPAAPVAKATPASPVQSAIVTALLENANTEVRPPENILANLKTADSDPKGVIADQEKLAREHNELFRQSARAQHELLEAVRKVYRERPELVQHQSRIKELMGKLQALSLESKPYQEARQAVQAADAAYRSDLAALQASLTNVAAPTAQADASKPDRASLEANVLVSRSALEQAAAKLEEAERALAADPARQAIQAEVARLQQDVQATFAQDASVQSLKRLSEELERKKKEVTRERPKVIVKTAS